MNTAPNNTSRSSISTRAVVAAIAGAVLCCGIVASAQISGTSTPGAAQSVPELIPYRGTLEVNGSRLDNQMVALRFSVYRGAAATNLVWQETHTNVPVTRGAFAVVLGSGTGTDFASVTASLSGVPLFQVPNLYLGVEIDVSNSGSNYLEVGARQRITGVAYAMTTRQARSFDVSLDMTDLGTMASPATLSSSSNINVNGASNVGSANVGALSVSGNVHSTGASTFANTLSAAHYDSPVGAAVPLGSSSYGVSAVGSTNSDYAEFPATGTSLCVLSENDRGVVGTVASRQSGCSITFGTVGANRRWTITATATSAGDWINCSMNCLYIP